MFFLYLVAGVSAYCLAANYLSYFLMKRNILASQVWGLNICCGKTDGGGINADIHQHVELPNFQRIEDVYRLPFADKQFQSVLCSHTIEHVEDPVAFYRELKRVGEEVTLVIPPLYDIAAVLNIFEHRWIFLSFRKKHDRLPPYVKLPLARWVQRHFGQINRS